MQSHDSPPLRGEDRPWGRWEILLEEPDYKVKRITVKPGHRLSYQKHARRKEYWTVVKGEAVATLDGGETRLGPGERADIPTGAAHRIANHGEEDLIFIEVQLGDYFGEDDIVRLEDDYGRVEGAP